MNKYQTEQLKPEEISNNETVIDGRVWLREILRHSKPKYTCLLEDNNKLQQIRDTISNTEVAYSNQYLEFYEDSDQIGKFKKQKAHDINIACPEQADTFLR